MKRSVMILTLSVVLIFAFAGTAFANTQATATPLNFTYTMNQIHGHPTGMSNTLVKISSMETTWYKVFLTAGRTYTLDTYDARYGMAPSTAKAVPFTLTQPTQPGMVTLQIIAKPFKDPYGGVYYSAYNYNYTGAGIEGTVFGPQYKAKTSGYAYISIPKTTLSSPKQTVLLLRDYR